LANPILHSFSLDADGNPRFCPRLNLSVGEDGVVGRRVSVVDARTSAILGEGIIGWN
jgi:hypothetical protein